MILRLILLALVIGTIPLEPGWGEVKEGPGEGPGSQVVRETLEEELRTVATGPSAWKDCSHWTVSLCRYGHVGGETRIIKGYECRPHSQPWQVALFQKTRLLCGATLIAPKWLLTAAHCRKPQYLVHLGEHNLQRWDGYEQTRTATKSFPHPHFNNSLPNKDHRNDIMLVKMSSAAVITRAVRPLTLSSQCVTAGTSCLISGWGTTSSPQLRLPHTLRCANITIIEHQECKKAYPGNITDTMVCASVGEEGKDSCQGDSGGPLVCNGSLQGIISWGQDPCAVTRKPGVYTKVCKYVDWIRDTMDNN